MSAHATSRSFWRRWFASPPPSVAVEVGARRVTAVALGSAAGAPTVVAHATEALPDGLVAPSLTSPNLTDQRAVASAVRRTLDALGTRARRVALVIPDGAAKVSLVKFEKVPPRAEDLDQLIRWQIKKAVPFPLDHAQLSWTTGLVDADGATELVITVARRDIVAEYEAACSAAGMHAGVVDVATFNLVNAVLAADGARGEAPADDWLLVHVAPDSSTLAILRGANLILFRNRASTGEGGLSDLVHQSAMYYEDRLGGRGLSRVVVVPRDLTAPALEELDAVCRSFEERSGSRAIEVDVRPVTAFADRISPSPELLRAVAAPVGALLRERAA
jgi:type IV pilus assembly protein PilM